MILEVRTGQREGSVISTTDFDVAATNHWETWDTLAKELEDVGVSHDTIVEKRAFIIGWFRDAVAAGKLEEDEPEKDEYSENEPSERDGGLPPSLGDIADKFQEEALPSSRTATTAKIKSAQREQVASSTSKGIETQGLSLPKASYVLGKLSGRDRALLDASRTGHELRARYWLSQGARIREIGSDRVTALHYAAVAGNETVLKLLVDHGANLDAQNNAGKTAVHYAVKARQETMLRLLLETGANVDEKDNAGQTPLALAMSSASAMTPQSLRGCDVQIAISRLLFRHGADPNSVCANGESILTHALRQGGEVAIPVLRALLEHGVSANVSSSQGTALSLASRGGGVEVVALLLDYGAEIDGTGDDDNHRTPLWWALDSDRPRVVRLLLQKGANVNATTRNGETLLFPAIRSAEFRVWNLRILLSRGADIEAQDAYGRTVLMKATHLGRGAVKAIQLLLANGANIEARSGSRETPLLRAIRFWNPNQPNYRFYVVLFLLRKGADTRAKDSDGKHALSRAQWICSKDPYYDSIMRSCEREKHDSLILLLKFATTAESEQERQKFLDDCQYMAPRVAARSYTRSKEK